MPFPREYYELMMLRSDALERQMLDLAIVYGWSAIRISSDHLVAETLNTKTNISYVPRSD